MTQEYYSLPDDEEPLVNFPREMNESQLPTPTAAELELVRRRELAVQATDAIAEVLDEQITVPELMRQADALEATPGRLRARRALRCVYDIGVEDSPVVAAVGEVNLYHYVEGVLQYGSNRNTYLSLMDTFSLTAEQATGLYALRELIADETDGNRIGFPALQRALKEVGLSMQRAADDPDGTIAAFTDAGFFVNYNGARIYDHPVFSVELSELDKTPGWHRDTIKDSAVQFAWIRDYVEDLGIYATDDNKETE
jgi:hypothetical protein